MDLNQFVRPGIQTHDDLDLRIGQILKRNKDNLVSSVVGLTIKNINNRRRFFTIA